MSIHAELHMYKKDLVPNAKAVLQADDRQSAVCWNSGTEGITSDMTSGVTILIIKLLIVTGLRVSELPNLRVRDVSPDGGQILVHGKGSKERIVFVPTATQTGRTGEFAKIAEHLPSRFLRVDALDGLDESGDMLPSHTSETPSAA